MYNNKVNMEFILKSGPRGPLFLRTDGLCAEFFLRSGVREEYEQKRDN